MGKMPRSGSFMEPAGPPTGWFSRLQSLMDKGDRVAHVGADELPVLHQFVKEGLGVQRGLMVQVLKEHIFQIAGGGEPFHQPFFIKQVAELDADFRVLVGVEGGDTAFGGAKRLPASRSSS